MSQLDHTSNRDEAEDSFVDLSLDEATAAENLSSRLETVNLSDSPPVSPTPHNVAAQHNTISTLHHSSKPVKHQDRLSPLTMGADDVLDDLTSTLDSPVEPPSGEVTVHRAQLHQPEPDSTVRTRHYGSAESRYDHLFEEVSLDLPRDPNPIISSPTSSRFFKLMSRKPSPPTAPEETTFGETNVDLSGPFYSISDVLEDTQAVVGPRSGGTQLKVGKSTPTGGARRGIQEHDIVAKSGGSSSKALKRRSSLNPFSRTPKQHPSALETVISKTRPVTLPPKNPVEEKRHLQQHEIMMKRAKAVEAKKEKQFYKRKEERDKQMMMNVKIWEEEILPYWHTKRQEKQTRDLWMRGLPPRCRGKIWTLAIGNSLNIPKETFYMYVKQQPKLPSGATSHGTADVYNSPDYKRLSNSTSAVPTPNKFSKSDSYPQYSKSGGDLPNINPQTEPFDPSKRSDISIHRKGRTSSLEVLKSDDNHSESSRRASVSSSASDVESHNGKIKSFVMERQFVDDSKHPGGHYDIMEREPSLPTENGHAIGIHYADHMRPIHTMNTTETPSNALSDVNLDDDDDEDDDDDNSEDLDNQGEDNALTEREDTQDRWSHNRMDIETEAYNYKVITEDILRTLPSLCVFQVNGPMYGPLREVLRAYITYRTDVGYVRGTSFLAGMFLLNLEPDRAFIALCNLIQKSRVLSAMFSNSEEGVRGYAKVFNVLFAENLPKLFLHFRNLSLTPNNYLTDWLTTVFASVLPLELSSRLWDLFVLQGDIVLFKAGLVVLKYLEPLLWGGSYGETVRTLNMGFVGEERGEELNAVMAVSGNITQGEQDRFFAEIMGIGGIRVDEAKFAELVRVHLS
ncbi:hypothetical protein K450DRAFT_219163 [Umbelopsis ramanniana AG]|uniref:Rab-GAP TBC domain-containing protein n=1 Tax=Umbelopsis ramanniana AG TaxID=1314678 RepID=A0AAD5HJ34_UMBRA|nr:uncharacterized protein K450DRAFT_219163 [Umbelopsis ramanniana AG]KAI8584296.1 hypothetical protein K450DRAFT_219163 [Umbelopsis ramanniana AG]